MAKFRNCKSVIKYILKYQSDIYKLLGFKSKSKNGTIDSVYKKNENLKFRVKHYDCNNNVLINNFQLYFKILFAYLKALLQPCA